MQPRMTYIRRTFVSLSLIATLACPSAYATPVAVTPQIAAKQAEAAAAQDKLDDLQAQLELRTEEYAAATEELQVTRGQIDKTRADLAVADKELAEGVDQLQSRAAGIYRTGNVGYLEVLLGTTSFQDFVSRMDLLRRMSRNDAELVSTVKDAREKVRRTKESLERREADQIVLRERAEVARNEVDKALTTQTQYVSGLNKQVKALIAEEQARQERLARERAAAAAAAAARAAAAAKNAPPAQLGELGSGHPEVVPIALQFVGKVEYVWGGTTPTGFDCSGFTQYCYAQLGIDIPRTSRSQFRAGTYIPADRVDLLTPGDLVFFGYDGDANRVHHVGMYVGDGNFVHAPATGQKVTVSSLSERIASKADYVGAVRF